MTGRKRMASVKTSERGIEKAPDESERIVLAQWGVLENTTNTSPPTHIPNSFIFLYTLFMAIATIFIQTPIFLLSGNFHPIYILSKILGLDHCYHHLFILHNLCLYCKLRSYSDQCYAAYLFHYFMSAFGDRSHLSISECWLFCRLEYISINYFWPPDYA